MSTPLIFEVVDRKLHSRDQTLTHVTLQCQHTRVGLYVETSDPIYSMGSWHRLTPVAPRVPLRERIARVPDDEVKIERLLHPIMAEVHGLIKALCEAAKQSDRNHKTHIDDIATLIRAVGPLLVLDELDELDELPVIAWTSPAAPRPSG